jgi:hypothetical protein
VHERLEHVLPLIEATTLKMAQFSPQTESTTMMAGGWTNRMPWPRHQRADDEDKGEAGFGQGRNKVKDKGTRSKR